MNTRYLSFIVIAGLLSVYVIWTFAGEFHNWVGNGGLRQKQLQLTRHEIVFFRVNMSSVDAAALRGGPLQPLPQYRCPCWMARILDHTNDTVRDLRQAVVLKTRNTPGLLARYRDLLEQGQNARLRCLPLVYVIGVSKSGTTDLWGSLQAHPKVMASRKEPVWWNRRILLKNPTLSEYLTEYDWAAEQLRQHDNAGLIVDGTPSALWNYDGWRKTPGNKGLTEPRYILAHTLQAVVPGAKLLVILRNPTDRLYSHFRMTFHSGPASLFHEWANGTVQNMSRCLAVRTVRSCAYDGTIATHERPFPGGVFLRAGMYSVFLRDWFAVFPREQFFIIKAEDYYSNRSQTVVATYDFLGLPKVSAAILSKVAKAKVRFSKKTLGANISQEPMAEETRRMLDGFYAPFNRDLAQLLRGDRFLWQKKP